MATYVFWLNAIPGRSDFTGKLFGQTGGDAIGQASAVEDASDKGRYSITITFGSALSSGFYRMSLYVDSQAGYQNADYHVTATGNQIPIDETGGDAGGVSINDLETLLDQYFLSGLINSRTNVTVRGELSGPIVIGMDYSADEDRFEWTIPKPSWDLTAAEAVFAGVHTQDATQKFRSVGEITDNGDTITITFRPVGSWTDGLRAGGYRWSAGVKSADNAYRVSVRGGESLARLVLNELSETEA